MPVVNGREQRSRREWFLAGLCRLGIFLLPAFPQSPVRSRLLMHLKEWNRELAEMEERSCRIHLLSMPRFLILDTTIACNLLCPSCYRQHHGTDLNREPLMPPDLVRRICKELFPFAKAFSPSINGEPLLSPYLDELLEMAERYGTKFGITTNATLLHLNRRAERLAPLLENMNVSFDSVTPSLFNRMRHPARFEVVLENVRLMGRLRQDHPFTLGFAVALYAENIRELPALVRLIHEVGGNSLRACTGVNFSTTSDMTLTSDCPSLYNSMRDEALREGERLGVAVSLPPPFVRSSGSPPASSDNSPAGGTPAPVVKKRIMCTPLYADLRVTHLGQLTSCVHHTPPAVIPCEDVPFRRLRNDARLCELRRLQGAPESPPSCQGCYILGREAESTEA
jgi:uncharacterized Fe-S cluster-containing radical SAM superfamily protein